MAFIKTNTRFISFASYDDVVQRDSRLFESNEGLDVTRVEDNLILASQTILDRIRVTDWWKDYQFSREPSLNYDMRLLPYVNPLLIQSREQTFTDLAVFMVFADYILPSVADFGNETSAEVQKIKYYTDRYNDTFKEIIEAGDWYDFSNNGTITADERAPSLQNRVRIR
jgi:hypothetical protein